MIFSTLSKRERLILISACVIIGAGLLYTLAIEPVFKRWVKIEQRISSRQVKLQKGLRLLNGRDAAIKKYEKYKYLVKGAKSAEQQMSILLSEIEESARKTNTYITVLKPLITKSQKLYQNFLAEVEFDTALPELMKFIYELHSSANLLAVDNIEIYAKSGQKNAVKARLHISKIIFHT